MPKFKYKFFVKVHNESGRVITTKVDYNEEGKISHVQTVFNETIDEFQRRVGLKKDATN